MSSSLGRAPCVVRWLSIAALGAACSTVPLHEAAPGGAGGSGGSGGSEVVQMEPSPAPRVVRLSHVQWENTVRDLLRLTEPTALRAAFPTEAQSAGHIFDNPADVMQVDPLQSAAYAAAAAWLSEYVTSDAARLSRIAPEAAGGEGSRARAFIESFGERAFRRPLAEAELAAYLEFFETGETAYDEMTGFEGGARMVIEALLQSPHFLYRIESSTQPTGDSIPLSSWEVAQRLSYFLTNSMPDDELLRAARAGELATAEAAREQAGRLLGSVRARLALGHFHDQLLNLEGYAEVSPASAFYPNVTERLGPSALTSARVFIDDLIFDRHQGFARLMNATHAFADAELARVYGLDGEFGDALVAVELPARERRGLLTQVGFLAANSTSINPDPIHRGVFVAKRVLCRVISAPPDDVTPLPASGAGTNRQIVERHTQSNSDCRNCHLRAINPYGFVFESYDAIGAYREMDNGLPVDSSASPILDGSPREVTGAVEFAEELAESLEAHQCYLRHLLEYAHGRAATEADLSVVHVLGEASLNQGDPMLDLIAKFVASDNFLERSVEELP